MKYVEVGGARMSAVGLGTWQFGSREWGYGHRLRRARRRGHRASGPSMSGSPSSTRPRSTPSADPSGSSGEPSVPVATRPSWPPRSSRSSPSARRAATGPGEHPAARGREHRPLPDPPAQPAGPAVVHHGRPSGQLMDEGVIGHAGVSNYSLARWQAAEDRPRAAGALQPGPLQPGRPPARAGAAALGAGQRPADHRLQPAGPGPPVGPLRRRAPSGGDGPGQLARLPPREPEAGRAADRCRSRRWRPPTTPRRRRWHWPGSSAGRTSS